jgi:hypothetical protein
MWKMTSDRAQASPLITTSGGNGDGNAVHSYFNYADQPATIRYRHSAGREPLRGAEVAQNQLLPIARWGVIIIEEQ